MKKRDMALVAALLLLGAAVMALALYSEQNRVRSLENIQAICRQLESVTNKPCELRLPPSGISDRKTSEAGQTKLAFASFGASPKQARVVEKKQHNCPVVSPIKGNRNSGIYHIPGGRSYNAAHPELCFATEQEAVMAGYRPAR